MLFVLILFQSKIKGHPYSKYAKICYILHPALPPPSYTLEQKNEVYKTLDVSFWHDSSSFLRAYLFYRCPINKSNAIQESFSFWSDHPYF